jgi:hypothetical protein
MAWYGVTRGIPTGTQLTTLEANQVYVTSFGTVSLDTSGNQTFVSPNNAPLPLGGNYNSMAAPLWGNMEFRTTGDSSKVFFRIVSDSVYISFYNLALAGTNGQIRATFQVVFCDQDSSVTFNYRSFDGSLNGVSAAQVLQNRITIGVQNNQAIYGVNYLDRGIYYAQSNAGPSYAQNLHNHLAVKFLRRVDNQVRVRSIATPPSWNYEYNTNSITPSAVVENLTLHKDTVVVNFHIYNLLTGSQVFDGIDTETIDNGGTTTFTSRTTYTPSACGYFRLTAVASVPAHDDINWSGDNYLSRNFFYFQNQTSYPYFEDFTYGLNPCGWATLGATVQPGDSVLLTSVPPRDGIAGALVIDRKDYNGNAYSPQVATTGDTITSAPINLAGKSGVYLSFVYQRGLKSDSSKAGAMNRVLFGPERTVRNAAGTLIQAGDTLLVLALDSTAAAINPAASGWDTLAILDGGIDAKPNLFRMLLPARVVGSHFRLRFMLLGHDNGAAWYANPTDENDSWVVDGIQMYAPVTNNDLEPVDVTFGTGDFTHIPRNVGVVFPKVMVRNNGIGNTQAQNVILSITDQLSRVVYWQKQSFYFDQTRTDSLLPMPGWNILGSQGGVFTVHATILTNAPDYDHYNDTNMFVKTLFIDDKYALDDNVPDTAGSMQSAQTNFYSVFTPLSSDSLRGVDAYMMNAAGGSMAWTVVIQDYNVSTNDTATIATRGVSYSSTGGGWLRSTFSPVYLTGGKMYRMHFTQTNSGALLGGDASKAYQFYTVQDATSPQYGVEFPSVDSLFQNSGGIYYPGTAATNISGGGILLPMIRYVFQGSSTFLPVELVSFTGARVQNGNALLAWKSAKEDGVLTYSVERQTETGWQQVVSAAAIGGISGSTYSAVDETAPQSEILYRLSETDLDGTTHILGTTTVSAIGSNVQRTLVAYPNPAMNQVHLSMNGGTIDQLIVRDVLGRQVFGLTPNQAGSSSLDLDFSGLPSGAYYIQAQSGDRWLTQQITIAR